MADFLKELLQARFDTLFVLAGLLFLGIALLGNISGKIQPGKGGRIACAVVGPILIFSGLWMHSEHAATEGGGPNTTPPPGSLGPKQPPSRQPNPPERKPGASGFCQQETCH